MLSENIFLSTYLKLTFDDIYNEASNQDNVTFNTIVNHKEGVGDEGLNTIQMGNLKAADQDDPPLLRQLKANAHIIAEYTATEKDSQDD